MLTWARYLLIVSVTAVLLTGPVLAAPSLPATCNHEQTDAFGVTKACSTGHHGCCAACSDSEKPCCQRSNSPTGDERDAGCGSCPLGECGCCQTSQGLTVVVLPDQTRSEPRLLAVPLVTADSVLNSRSDEPLLPPPIA
jgi:hypothetical protein